MKSRWWMAGATVLALGCAESMPVEPAPDLTTAKGGVADATATQTITVMTRNLYVGADVDAIIAAIVGGDPEEILASLVVWGSAVGAD